MTFKLKVILACLVASLTCSLHLGAKQIPSELFENIMSQIAENQNTESVDATKLYDDLTYYIENPINLNYATKEDLEKLQSLSPTQIENLLYYQYMYFPMETIYELQLVEGFYGQDIRNLLPFVYVNKNADSKAPIKWKNVLKYGKHEVIIRADKTLETKAGYKAVDKEILTEDPNKQYLGDPYYHHLKYRFRYKNQVYAGFTAEKDAGEQFWGNEHKGYDYYSAYLQINDYWKFKTIVLGNYGASFGQGLVINTNFGFGKSSMVTKVDIQNTGLFRYSSTNEYNYLQGIGATTKFGKTELTAFYSNKMLDGDTIGNTFTSIKGDGLFRLPKDLSKKEIVNQQLFGAHAQLNLKWFQLGGTFTHMQLSHSLIPTPYPYNYYYFKGNTQTLGSVDYKFRWRKFLGTGETAVTDNNNWATINSLTFSPNSSSAIIILQRYYSPEYNSLFANAFSESSKINNEKALYIGAEVNPFQSWKFSAYADSYQFPWLKYGIDQPSSGYDLLFQTDYNPTRNTCMYWLFRYEQKMDNMANDSCITPDVDFYDKASLHYRLSYSISEQLKLQNTIEGTYTKKGDESENWGFLLTQDLSYKFADIPLSIDLRYEIFDAQNYENRIYSYEKDVLYAFSVPMLYGKGTRYYLNLKYQVLENLSLYFKIAQTTYVDRETISSDLEEIDGNRKTDVKLVVKWKFRESKSKH